jgi:hypothetical protein
MGADLREFIDAICVHDFSWLYETGGTFGKLDVQSVHAASTRYASA